MLSEHENAKNPFFLLPQEIKDIIYSFVFNHGFLFHIQHRQVWKPKGTQEIKFYHVRCLDPSFNNTGGGSFQGHPDLPLALNCPWINGCYSQIMLWHRSPNLKASAGSVRYALLFVCRQFFEEMKYHLYRRNVSSFNHAEIMRLFTNMISRTSSEYKLAIRWLHLHIIITCKSDVVRWKKTINFIVKKFRNVEKLFLSISLTPQIEACTRKGDALYTYMTAIVPALGKLPLTSVVVTMKGQGSSDRWTTEEKQMRTQDIE